MKMRFREIEEVNINHDDKKESDNYLQINPVTDITIEEARNFINSLFERKENNWHSKKVNGK